VPRRERGSSSLSSTEGLALEAGFDELKDMLIDGDLGFLKEKVEDRLPPGSRLLPPVGVGEGSGCARAHACSRVSERA
tara:strand:- start:92 stop:325 length:234 start_codon:yes stop_codon:yes gene_type:complete